MRTKREENELEYSDWVELENGGRRYWRMVVGKSGGQAKYVKVTDRNEITLTFTQEIYSSEGRLIEVHQKYPIDLGHKKLNT